MTTTDVCEKYVKPATIELRCSYCDMMRLNQSEAVGIAKVFISHAWAYQFLDVCDALMYHFKDNLDIIVWFDLFAVNQHTTTLKPFEWWTTTFQSAIKDFGETVMVFAPWQDPVPLRRAWCLWELYSTVKMECRFEVALNRSEQEKFFADICRDTQGSINKMLATVDVENSQCWNPLDRERIFEVVKSSVGFPKLNSVVFERLREWATTITAKEIETLNNNPEQTKLKLMMQGTLGRLYMQQGEYYKAKDLFDEIFLPFKLQFGEYSQETIDIVYQIGVLRLTMRDFPEAVTLLEEVIEKRTELSGDANDPQILVTKHKMGLLRERQEKFDEARSLYEEVYRLMREILGEKDKRTLSIMSDLASFYDTQEEKQKAEELYHQCYELHKEALGPNHQDTISVYYNLSCLYYDQEKYTKALEMMEDCYQRRVIALGEGHVSSLDILHAIACGYEALGDIAKAKELMNKRIAIYKQFFGPNALTTLYELGELVKWYKDRKFYAEVVDMAVDWWQRCYKTVGPQSGSTKTAWKHCVFYYKKLGKGDAAELLMPTVEPPKPTADPEPNPEVAAVVAAAAAAPIAASATTRVEEKEQEVQGTQEQ
jgi:tetratricopeptide (TPR) repeat protein